MYIYILFYRWNFTVGEVDLSLVGLEERGEVEGEVGGDLPFQVDAARGVVYGKGGREGETKWHQLMSAPITSLWVQDGFRLSRVNLSSHSALPNHQRPTLMMGEPSSTSYFILYMSGRHLKCSLAYEKNYCLHITMCTDHLSSIYSQQTTIMCSGEYLGMYCGTYY